MSSCGNNFNGNIVLNSTASFDPTKITINSSDLTKLGVAKVITGDSVTFNLTPLVGGNGTNGVDGREIELQKTATHIQWRYVGATNVWNNLVLLTEITGPQGIQGIQGIQGVTGTAGSNGTNGASSYTYIGYADDATGTGFTTTFAETKNFIAIKATTNPIATPVAADFTGLWKNYKGATGATGPAGATYTHPNHTGEVTSTGDGATSIALNAVTNTKLADMPTTTIKGRQTTGAGDPEDLTPTAVRTMLNVADGATKNDTDANLRSRATHTGTQLASTISDFTTAARASFNGTAGRVSITDGVVNIDDKVVFNNAINKYIPTSEQEFYNTADQVTNVEKVVMKWVTNVFTILPVKIGTGILRALNINGLKITDLGYINASLPDNSLSQFSNNAETCFYRPQDSNGNSLLTNTATGKTQYYNATIHSFGNQSGAGFMVLNSVTQEITIPKYKVTALNVAPVSATDTGVLGEIRYTADHIYVCVAANTWKRTAISTWV